MDKGVQSILTSADGRIISDMKVIRNAPAINIASGMNGDLHVHDERTGVLVPTSDDSMTTFTDSRCCDRWVRV